MSTGQLMGMPQYQSHKKVKALKIGSLSEHGAHGEPGVGSINDGGATITPEDKLFGSFEVSERFMRKHNPSSGGYYVQYSDGYESFSPAEAFEEGYTRI